MCFVESKPTKTTKHNTTQQMNSYKRIILILLHHSPDTGIHKDQMHCGNKQHLIACQRFRTR